MLRENIQNAVGTNFLQKLTIQAVKSKKISDSGNMGNKKENLSGKFYEIESLSEEFQSELI
jgi:hypothetical protein